MNHSTLHLTLSEAPFQVMVTGEKTIEFRKPSDWIKSRLFNSNGTRKEFDVVKFTHGYKKNAPFFISIFNGFDTCKKKSLGKYSNGLEVSIEEGDILIYLGEILSSGNLKKN